MHDCKHRFGRRVSFKISALDSPFVIAFEGENRARAMAPERSNERFFVFSRNRVAENKNAEFLGLLAALQSLCKTEGRDHIMAVLFQDELPSAQQRLVVGN